MSDTGGAIFFGDAFEFLAKSKHKEAASEFASFLWEKQEEFDFHPVDMDAEKAVRKLLPHVCVRCNRADGRHDGDCGHFGKKVT